MEYLPHAYLSGRRGKYEFSPVFKLSHFTSLLFMLRRSRKDLGPARFVHLWPLPPTRSIISTDLRTLLKGVAAGMRTSFALQPST
jgi:hypothetical protein